MTAMSWCTECRRLTSVHPLVHLIDTHAPRLGDRRRGERSWRTSPLIERTVR